MIGFYRNAIEAARAHHRARRALIWECVALQHRLAVLRRSGTRRPRFRPIDRLFWIFLSWWWPAWRDALKVIQPETVLRWRNQGIALIWKYRSRGRWRGGRPRIALETRQLIREMARANFLWGAPRIHGELLKFGITVSQATVSRYMPPPQKDRRSQAWRTLIRNHAISVVKIRSFNARNCTRDLLSQIWSRPRVFTYHLSAFVVASVTCPLCLVGRTTRPLPVGRGSHAAHVLRNHKRLNLPKLWEGPRKNCQGFKPDPGSPPRDRKSGKRKPRTYSWARARFLSQSQTKQRVSGKHKFRPPPARQSPTLPAGGSACSPEISSFFVQRSTGVRKRPQPREDAL